MNPVRIVGILNTTPDSYFDGGKYNLLEVAVAHAGQMLEAGADIIDVGGESTIPSGPGGVTAEEEISRTIPVIEAIVDAYPDASISIDTYKAEVASRAITAGATMVNDVSAGRNDPEMFPLIASSDVHYILMHAVSPPPNVEIHETHYDDVVSTVKAFLQERRDEATSAGIAQDRLILDPGLGFFISSIADYSFEIIERLEEFLDLGCPLYVSPSRKSFLAGPENLPPKDRLPATIEASLQAAKNGATYIRTHDVADIATAFQSLHQLKLPKVLQ